MNATVKFFGTLIILLIGIYLFASLFTDIAVYLTIATLLTTILLPLTERLVHFSIFGKQISRSLAAFLGFVVFIGVITLFGSLFVPLIKEQIENISNLDNQKLSTEYTDAVNWAENILINYGMFSNEGDLFIEINTLKEGFIRQIQVKNLFSAVFSITGSVLVGMMAVFFMTFFFLREKGELRMGILKLIPNRYFEFFVTAYHKTRSLLMNYLTGLLVQMVVIFSLTTLGLSIIGVKYAVIIGCFTALANLIPYAGPFLGASFGAIIGISTSPDLGPELGEYAVFIGKIGVVFATVQLTDNIFLQPIIFSKSVKAHPLEIFVIIFAGANIAGVMGMILAIPVYTILKVALTEIKFGYSQYHIFKK